MDLASLGPEIYLYMLVFLALVTFYFSRRHKGPVVHYSQKARAASAFTDDLRSQEPLHATDFIIWNAGIVPLEPRQLKSGLNVVLPEDVELVDAEILKPQSEQALNYSVSLASLHEQEDGGAKLPIHFMQIKPRQGLVLRLTYSGEPSESFVVEGQTRQLQRKASGIALPYLYEHFVIRMLKMFVYAGWYVLMFFVVVLVVTEVAFFVALNGYTQLITAATLIVILFIGIFPPTHLKERRVKRGGPPWPYPFTLWNAPYRFEE